MYEEEKDETVPSYSSTHPQQKQKQKRGRTSWQNRLPPASHPPKRKKVVIVVIVVVVVEEEKAKVSDILSLPLVHSMSFVSV